MSIGKFDERLCLEQCFRHIAYERLYAVFMEKVISYPAERASKSTLLSLLNDSCCELIKYYNEVPVSSDVSLSTTLADILNKECANSMVNYISQAKDTLAIEICNMNRPTKKTVNNSLKNLVSAKGKLDWSNEL